MLLYNLPFDYLLDFIDEADDFNIQNLYNKSISGLLDPLNFHNIL